MTWEYIEPGGNERSANELIDLLQSDKELTPDNRYEIAMKLTSLEISYYRLWNHVYNPVMEDDEA